ncbi:MAG: hypothetical protein QXY83_01680 [Thermosphaera sp.]
MTILNILALALTVFYPSKILLLRMFSRRFGLFEAHIISDTFSFFNLILLALFSHRFDINPTLVLSSYLALVTVAAVLFNAGKRHISSISSIIFAMQVAITIAVAYFSAKVPRTYLPDETSYIYAAQLLEARFTTFSLRYPIETPFGKYFGSRALIIGYLYSLKMLLNIPFTETHMATSLFVAMMVPAVMGILHEAFAIKDEKFLTLFTVFSVLSPGVILWGLTVLPDVPESYFILSFTYIFINTIRTVKDFMTIDALRMLVAASYLYAILVLLKGNILFVTIVFSLSILYLFKLVRSYSMSKSMKITLVFLKIGFMILCALLLLDLCYFLSVHVLKNIHLAIKLRPYLIHTYLLYGLSPIETFLGWFVSYPWKPQTLMTLTYEEWISRLNFAISPELMGPVGAAMPLFPLLLTMGKISKKAKILLFSSLLTFWLSFFHLILHANFHDFFRYNLHIYVLFSAFSIVETYYALCKLINFYVFIIKLFIPLFISYGVMLCCRGSTYFWLMESEIKSFSYLFLELLIFMGIIALWEISRRKCNFRFSFILNFSTKTIKIENKKHFLFMFVSILVVLSCVFGFLFSALAIKNTLLMFSPRNQILSEIASKLNEELVTTSSEETIYVISNFHMYLRNYINLSRVTILPMPTSFNEFLRLIDLLSGKIFIAITNDYFISYYTIINKELRNILFSDNKILHNYELRQIYDTRWQEYRYALYFYERGKDKITGLELAGSEVHVLMYWNFSSRTCVLFVDRLSNSSIILSSLKFARIITLNSSTHSFPLNDPQTKMDVAYQVCHSSLIITATSVKYAGFSILSFYELFSKFALINVLLLSCIYFGKKSLFPPKVLYALWHLRRQWTERRTVLWKSIFRIISFTVT